MRYRRFGRTELQMPVFSCGGMRYQHKWNDVDPNDVPTDEQENLADTIHRALELGINHIETARGYGSSEMQLGWVLPKIERDKLIVQTKVGPNEDPKKFLENFEKSMAYLQLDHVDLLSFHGINNSETLDYTLRKGGCLEVARQLQKDGRVRFVGFSTHGTHQAIEAAVESGEFDYFNVHWYFVNDLNWHAIEMATQRDMGVFIISPTDKGGRLHTPSDKIKQLCAPLSPIEFNDLYCLNRPEVHTLSIGASRPSDFDEHLKSLRFYDEMASTIAPIEARLRAQMERVHGRDWCENWWRGVPEVKDLPGQIHVLEILRLHTYGTAFDLEEWAKGRYNLMGRNDHFFPGDTAQKLDEYWPQMQPMLQASPVAAQIEKVLRDSHAALAKEEIKRLSQSDD